MWHYLNDLAYVELQPDLFRHVFPACLKYWYETLMRDESASPGDADFHYALEHSRLVDKTLSGSEKSRLFDFFVDGFLDRVEAQSSLKKEGLIGDVSSIDQHGWIFRFNSLGVVAPVIEPIWQGWWALDHPGKINCAALYASGLIYDEGANPIYGKWTSERGGGGPYLTETDANIFDLGWRQDNLEFLRGALTTESLLSKLKICAEETKDEEGGAIVRAMLDDGTANHEYVSIRIELLLADLEIAKGKK